MRLDTDIRSFEKLFEECATDERIWQVNRCTGGWSVDSMRSLETGARFFRLLVGISTEIFTEDRSSSFFFQYFAWTQNGCVHRPRLVSRCVFMVDSGNTVPCES